MKKRRAVIYGRVSSEKEMQLSAFKNQMLWYDEIEQRYGDEFDFVGRYMDKGITGTSAKKRPDFMRMIEDAKKGLFDIIFTREVARFARNFVESVTFARELAKYGVEVFFINDNIHSLNPEDNFKLGLMSLMAEEESRKDSERAKAGLHIARTQRDSVWGSGNILGYKPRGGHGVDYEIDPEQAETVKMIKDMYLYKDMSIMDIKDQLELLGRKTSEGCTNWHASTIGRILSNPFYCGYQILRQSEVNNYLEQKRQKLPKEEYIFKKVNVPTLYTMEEYEKIQEIKNKRYNKFTNRGIRRNTYFWSDKILCGCGSTMSGQTWRVVRDNEPVRAYRCYNQIMNKTKASRERRGLSTDTACGLPQVQEWKLEMMALYIFKHLWTTRGVDIEVALSIIKECYKNNISDNQAELDRYNKEITRYKNKKNNLVDMCADGLIDKATLKTKLDECNENIKMYEDNIHNLVKGDFTLESLDEQLGKIKETLQTALDCTGNVVDRDMISELVEYVVESDKNKYTWFLKLAGESKDNVNIPLEYQLQIKKRQTHNQDIKIIKDKRLLIYKTTLHYDDAVRYRKARGSYMRKNAWDDIDIEVYLA